MSDAKCPICKTDSYLNPEMMLYISPCFHKMCESCLNRYFINGKAACPECGIELRKINYITSTFEDIEVEKECRIRRQLEKYFHKEEEDFPDSLSYNDYLEKMENFVYELTELKSESLIKQRINEVINSNLFEMHKKEEKEIFAEETRNKQPVDYIEIECDVKDIFYKVKSSTKIPSNFISESMSGGLSRALIISYAINLLYNE